jgi:predicted dehydrogenase
LHYSKLYQIAKEWIDAGKIGEPVNIQTRYFCCEFHRKDNWRSNSTGSFLIGEKLSHYLDLQRYFFGEQFESIYSLSSRKVVPYFRHRDNHQIMTKYPNGKVAVLNFIMYLAETDFDELSRDPLIDLMEKQADDGCSLSYHICGTRGAIETDVFRRRIRRWEFGEREDGMTSRIAETLRFTREEDQVYFHNVYGEVQHVIGLVANGRKSEMDGKEALETMGMCFAAEMSENRDMPINRNVLSTTVFKEVQR